MAVPPTPLVWQEGGTSVVPGHGRICDKSDVVDYRDMVTIIRDVVQDMIKKGMTLEQIQPAEPTKGYASATAPTPAPWTTAMFVDAVYESLTKVAERDESSAQRNRRSATLHVAAHRAAATSAAASRRRPAPGQARRPVRQAPRRRRRRRRKAAAPIDLTGNWVSIVTEDWRWRMVTPPKGDYASMPLNAEAQEGRRRVGSGQGRSRRRAVQVVRRARHDARARTSAHLVAGRQHAEGRDRRRHADAPASFRRLEIAGGEPTWQGDSVAAVGDAAPGAASRRRGALAAARRRRRRKFGSAEGR